MTKLSLRAKGQKKGLMKETLYDKLFPYLFISIIPVGFAISAWLYFLPNHACYDLCVYPIPAIVSVALIISLIIVD